VKRNRPANEMDLDRLDQLEPPTPRRRLDYWGGHAALVLPKDVLLVIFELRTAHILLTAPMRDLETLRAFRSRRLFGWT
jgi:hypothetical protein